MNFFNATTTPSQTTFGLDSNVTGLSKFPFQGEYFQTIKALAPICAAIVLFGLISNVINVIVFLKTGAKDNVTILLLCLAISDLVFLALISPSMCGSIIQALITAYDWPFDSNILRFLLYWPAFTAYDLSTFISVSLGVTRCACVAMPLKFKLVFTRSRTIKWVMLLVVFAVLLRLPVLTVHRISWKMDPKTNVSTAYLTAVNNKFMSRINDILNRGVVIYLSYVSMVICVWLLTLKLRQASKVRRKCDAAKSSEIPHSAKPASDIRYVDQGLSPKDLQVIKSVVLVCALFVLLQLPFLLTSTTRLVTAEFDNFGNLVYLFGTASQINRTCSYLNASLNIFIYYKYNSKYRSVFRSLLLLTYRI